MRCLIEGRQAGVLRQGEPMPLALGAWSLVHGLASLLVDRVLDRSGKGAVDAEALAHLQTRLLFEGLCRDSQNG